MVIYNATCQLGNMSEAQLLLLRQKLRERELEEQKRREELGIQPESTALATEAVDTQYQKHGEVMDVDEKEEDDEDEISLHHNNPEVDMPTGMIPPNTTLSNASNNVATTENLTNNLIEDTTNDDRMPSGKKQNRKSKYGMYQDIEEMMFGFGDNWPPAPDSVELIEDLAVKYIKDLCQRALEVADYTGKLDKQCFMYAVRKDTRKFSRAYSLLKANEELKTARTSTIAEEEKHTEVLRAPSIAQHHADDNDTADATEGAGSGVHVGHDNTVAGGQGKGGGRGGGGRGKGSSGRNKNSGEPGDISGEGGGGRGRGRGGGPKKSSDGPGGGRGRGRGGKGRGKGGDTGAEDANNAPVEPAAAALMIEPDEEN